MSRIINSRYPVLKNLFFDGSSMNLFANLASQLQNSGALNEHLNEDTQRSIAFKQGYLTGNAFGKSLKGDTSHASSPSASQWVSLGTSAADDWTSALSGDRPQFSSSANNGFGFISDTLASGNRSKVGTGLVNGGATVMNMGLQTGNGWLCLAGGVAGALGTLANAAWGSNINQENVDKYNQQIKQTSMLTSRATNSNDYLAEFNKRSTVSGFGQDEIGTDGWWSHKAHDLYRDMDSAASAAREANSINFNNRASDININNTNNALANMSAFGGPIEREALLFPGGRQVIGLSDKTRKTYNSKNKSLTTRRSAPEDNYEDGDELEVDNLEEFKRLYPNTDFEIID